MGRKPRVDRSPEEKWQIVQEGIKSGNVSETCRRHGIAPNLFYRWKDEAEQGAKAALGGRSAAAAETEKDHRIRQLERTLGRKSLEIEILKNVVGGVSCGAVHSQAREMVTQGYTATLVVATLAISRVPHPTVFRVRFFPGFIFITETASGWARFLPLCH